MYEQKLVKATEKLLMLTAINPPDDIKAELGRMRQAETSPRALGAYAAMHENMALAAELGRPVCQDTGLPQFFLKAGWRFPHLGLVEAALTEAIKRATIAIPLRPNAVEPFTNTNSGDNTGTHSPWIDWQIVPDSDELELDVYLSGAGCSLPGTARVLPPGDGFKGVMGVVMDAVTGPGINACPPLLVGVGIGACAPTAAKLSKIALMRGAGTGNALPKACEFEQSLKLALQAAGIGPLGLGGDTSIIGVNVEFAARHTATLAVGVTVGCWATRYGKMRVYPDLSFKITSHSEANQA